jgi:CheY-like chemotaxis protein
MMMILWNIIKNALKYPPRGGGGRAPPQRSQTDVHILISDTGEGIDPSFLPHIFEPFRQAEHAMTRVHGGLGLGLSIVRYLVEAHGGTIRALSEGSGRGATFMLALPVQAQPSAGASEVVQQSNAVARQTAVRLDAVRILLVDDDPDGRKIVRIILTHAGAEVTTAASAMEAWQQFEQLQPHLVVTDIAMPQMDGYALAKRIREVKPAQKIIALTAFPRGRAGMQDELFDNYLTKPVDPVALIEAAARLAKSL